MKDKVSAGLLALFLGKLGVHKFYLGKPGAGFAYLIFFVAPILLTVMTMGVAAPTMIFTLAVVVMAVVDSVRLLSMDPRRFNELYNGGEHFELAPYQPAPQHPQNIVVNVSDPNGTRAGRSSAEQLKGLHDLLVVGAITTEEYEAQKKKILA